MQGAARRFPFLADAGVVKLVCHPDAMTPDGNPLVGELPGVPGFFVAAGLSLNGFGGAGGIGKAMAELVTSGEAELDLQAYRPWRFGAVHRDPRYAAETAREAYRYYYRLRYPLDSDVLGRPRRTSALHGRMQDAGAVFTAKNGWERADYCRPGEAWRNAGEEQRAFGWAAPPYAAVLAEESAAVRERVGMIDMTSFGKIAVEGPGAAALLERVCDAHVERAPGSVVYTQFLNQRGGIVADVTVTRLGEQRFRVVTGAAAIDSDLGWLRLHRDAADGPVALRDETDDVAVIGMWGPHARDVLAAVTPDDVSGGAFPFGSGRGLSVGGTTVWAQRITYVGELGYEMYVEPAWGVQVWDRLAAAGAAYGLRPIGYRVLDSLRMEKGYRAFASDLTAGDTPDEAGLGFCVALERKGDFIGRAAIEARRAERARAPPAHPDRRRGRPGARLRRRGGAGGRRRGRAGAQRRLRLHDRAHHRERVSARHAGRRRAARRRGARPPRARGDRARRALRPGAHPRALLRYLPGMLTLLPNCECCDRDLPPESEEARICTYECTFCAECAEQRFANICPNCGGDLVRRPIRPPEKLLKHPAATERFTKAHPECLA